MSFMEIENRKIENFHEHKRLPSKL